MLLEEELEETIWLELEEEGFEEEELLDEETGCEDTAWLEELCEEDCSELNCSDEDSSLERIGSPPWDSSLEDKGAWLLEDTGSEAEEKEDSLDREDTAS